MNAKTEQEKIVRAAVRTHPVKAAYLLAVLLYIVGMVLGSSFILCVPFLNHRDSLLTMARDRGEYSLTYFVNYPHPTFGMEYYLFREDGEPVVREQMFLADREYAGLDELFPKLFEDGQLYTIKRYAIGNEGARIGKVFCIVAGQVVEGSTGLRFASIVIRDLNDIDTFLETFAGIYTIIFVTAVILLSRISRQHGELMNLQRDLVSNVSHELKTPITSIKAMAELIYDGMYDTEEDMKRYTSSILKESDRLEGLVKEILELAKLQNHKVELKKALCYADGIFTPVVDRYMMLCGDLGIELDTSALDLEAIPALYTDMKYITRVMNILLENAVKFVGTGGRIELGSQPLARHVVFCVKDNGPGIDSADIDRIFERFYKADVTHNSRGSGLGLSIASETIKGLGERILVESTRGVGSAFYFTVGYK